MVVRYILQKRRKTVIILKNLKNVFFVSELRKKLLFTLGVIVVFRLGHYIPVIGVDVVKL